MRWRRPLRRGPPRRRRPSPFVIALVALIAVLATACGSARSSGDSPFEEGAGSGDSVRVTIENRNFKDATVWALWNGNRIRVGRVTGNTTDTFQMRYRGDEVRFEVDFLAGDDYVGESIGVLPGDHLELVIGPVG